MTAQKSSALLSSLPLDVLEVVTRNEGAPSVGGQMHVTHEDRRGTRRMESATDTDSRDNNHGDVGSQTALCLIPAAAMDTNLVGKKWV